MPTGSWAVPMTPSLDNGDKNSDTFRREKKKARRAERRPAERRPGTTEMPWPMTFINGTFKPSMRNWITTPMNNSTTTTSTWGRRTFTSAIRTLEASTMTTTTMIWKTTSTASAPRGPRVWRPWRDSGSCWPRRGEKSRPSSWRNWPTRTSGRPKKKTRCWPKTTERRKTETPRAATTWPRSWKPRKRLGWKARRSWRHNARRRWEETPTTDRAATTVPTVETGSRGTIT
mmetsp:Transcript_84033/g.170434  ORF Transcript_84033/g.170434 Transcript_84033/m.170434 type:complete len:230 (-) Transcript_84033:452-1141(-)